MYEYEMPNACMYVFTYLCTCLELVEVPFAPYLISNSRDASSSYPKTSQKVPVSMLAYT